MDAKKLLAIMKVFKKALVAVLFRPEEIEFRFQSVGINGCFIVPEPTGITACLWEPLELKEFKAYLQGAKQPLKLRTRKTKTGVHVTASLNKVRFEWDSAKDEIENWKYKIPRQPMPLAFAAPLKDFTDTLKAVGVFTEEMYGGYGNLSVVEIQRLQGDGMPPGTHMIATNGASAVIHGVPEAELHTEYHMYVHPTFAQAFNAVVKDTPVKIFLDKRGKEYKITAGNTQMYYTADVRFPNVRGVIPSERHPGSKPFLRANIAKPFPGEMRDFKKEVKKLETDNKGRHPLFFIFTKKGVQTNWHGTNNKGSWSPVKWNDVQLSKYPFIIGVAWELLKDIINEDATEWLVYSEPESSMNRRLKDGKAAKVLPTRLFDGEKIRTTTQPMVIRSADKNTLFLLMPLA